jgi:bifunctional non-homologous end joining protein LigD
MMKKSKSSIPGFIQPQIPFDVLSPPLERTWIHEIKFDGMRLQVHVENTALKLFNTKGDDVTELYPTLGESILEMKLKNAIMEGEAVILDKQGKSQFQQLEKALTFREDLQVKIFFFDLLYLNGVDLRKKTLVERKNELEAIIPSIHPRLRYSNHVLKDPESFFEINCKQQLEGIVSKVAASPYVSGKSSYWCKTRCSKTQSFFIAGFNDETEEFLLGHYERNKLQFAGKVSANGNYMKIKKKLAKIPKTDSSFEKFPQQKNIYWVEPILKAEINFSNWTDEKRLRNPVLIDLVT